MDGMQEFFSSADGGLEPMIVPEVPDEAIKPTANGQLKIDWGKVADVAQFATDFINKLPSRQRTEIDNAIRAACGRKPLVGKDKKAQYEACAKRVIDQYMSQFQTKPSSGGQQVIYRKPTKKTNLTPLWIGLAVLAAGGVAFYLYRRSKA
jgi:hypothetical protein